jgi:hypothetical protein
MTTTLNWPAAVPLPSIAGYAIKPKPNVDRTEVEIGQARQRRRSTTTTDDIPVRFELNAFQHALFEAWFKERALEGAAWFNVTLLSGLGLQSHEARFKGGEQLTHTPRSGERWVVDATLEVRNRPMLSDADLTIFLAEDGDVLFAALRALHTLVWTDIANL